MNLRCLDGKTVVYETVNVSYIGIHECYMELVQNLHED